jgi:rare lipoprotein A (peptidoglycan hydrolase)
MQTKLKTVLSLLAVSLLWTPKAFAATQTKAQNGSVHKNQVIGTASRKHHSTTHGIKIVWCDLHICEEKMHFVGTASYYGKGYWQGRKMANGERFDYRRETVALWFLPLGTKVRITNLDNGLTAVAEVTDRGPAHSLHRIADLSQVLAEELDYTQKGLAHVTIQPIIKCDTESASITDELQPPQINVDKRVVSVLE